MMNKFYFAIMLCNKFNEKIKVFDVHGLAW